jgi:ABC-type nickel/cobalt efflux system permease component RcnA
MAARFKALLQSWNRKTFFLMIITLSAVTPVAFAHPMGNFSVNHYTKIDVGDDRVTVRYFIDLAEIPTYQEMQQAGIQADANDPAISRYIENRGKELAFGLNLVLNGVALPLRMTSSGVVFPPGAGGLPTMKMGFVYQASYPAGTDRTYTQLRYADNNFPGHMGWKEIVAVASAGTLLSSSVPAIDRSHELNNYPTDLLNSPPETLEANIIAALPVVSGPVSNRATTTVKDQASSLVLTSRAGASALIAAKSDGHDLKTKKSFAGSSTSPLSALSRGDAPTANAPLILKANAQQTPRNKFTELISAPHLSIWFLLTAAVIAIGLGGLHALEPGHGKTIIAAYLVGSRGTAAHAVLLGLIVTLSHTAGVFALGAITLYASRYILPEQLYPWLGLFSGLTIAVLGCYMALRRLTGTASDHSHLPGESHSHWSFFRRTSSGNQPKDLEAAVPTTKTVSLTQLLTLGITGGIIPCPAALIVLLSAVTLHRIGLGFFLIVAFSLGLAAVLIGFGMLMVFAKRFMSQIVTDGPLTNRWLPLASSAFITVLGIALVVQAASSMHLHVAVFSHTIFSQDKIGGLLMVTGLGLILGMRHSTDTDHVVAISTIISRQKSVRGAAVIGSVWGLGHTITIFVVGSMIILFKVEIPPRVGLSMEFCVALMLVLLGALNLSGAMQKITRIFMPAKMAIPAISNQSITSRSSGTALGQLGLFQCIRPLVIGLVHGLAGSAAVALLVLSTIHDPMWATVYLLIFGAGTMLGMMAMTTLMATSLNFAGQRFASFSRHLGTVSGMVSMCFGSFLVFQLGVLGGLFTSHPVWIPR